MSISGESACEAMLYVAQLAAARVAHAYHANSAEATEKGSHASLVTEVDVEANKLIVRELQRRFSDATIVSEEGEVPEPSDSTFYVDPIDGTMNFVHGVPDVAVSIGYYQDGHPVAGVVMNPITGTTFHAIQGGGAYRDFQCISPSSTDVLRRSLLASGWPYDKSMIAQTAQTLGRVCTEAREVRIIGSAALAVCHVASGVFDGFWESGLEPWDLAGSVAVAHEAGALVTDRNGEEFDISSGDIVVTNGRFHRSLIDVVNEQNITPQGGRV